MNKEQKQVKEFMQTFGQETPSSPCIPSFETRKLRAKLILEEAIELIKGLGFVPNIRIEQDGVDSCDVQVNSSLRFRELCNPDLTEIADGIADSMVVQLGTAIACGLDMEPIFEEVHRSNMTKLWTRDDLEQKLYNPPDNKEWFDTDGLQHFITPVGNPDDELYLVKDKDGKVIKSPSYSPANIQQLIERQQAQATMKGTLEE